MRFTVIRRWSFVARQSHKYLFQVRLYTPRLQQGQTQFMQVVQQVMQGILAGGLKFPFRATDSG